MVDLYRPASEFTSVQLQASNDTTLLVELNERVFVAVIIARTETYVLDVTSPLEKLDQLLTADRLMNVDNQQRPANLFDATGIVRYG